MDSSNRICWLASAARLASMTSLKRRGGFNASIRYYKSAIRQCSDTFTKTKLINEIALLYAYQKNPSALKEARIWYDQAFANISAIQNKKQRIHMEILLNNGLALVEYHDSNNMKALSLERRALSLVPMNPEIEEWALQLCNYNIAKLMMRRFHDEKRQSAILKEI
jgi:hypothetical protein